ncbi:MAG: xanthine dehydrogenase family protein molybdopterin-binding subunit [Acidimicrobiales bacterium]
MALRGTPVVRREDAALLTGRGVFVADAPLPPGAAHAAFVTSPHAHALIRGVDTAAAAAAPGVLGVFSAAELDGFGPTPPPNPNFHPAMVRPLLAEGRVRFVGEPVAVVVAQRQEQAVDAAELVEVDYDPLPVVVSPEEALGGEVALFADAADNVAIRFDAPDLVPDFAACEVVVSERVVNCRVAPCPIETRVAAAWWEDGRLIHLNAGQGPHPVRTILAKLYGLEREQVRVISRDVGGGFGAKARPHPEELLLGWLARALERPVRWVPTRTEDMLGLGHGRAAIQRLTIGGSRDGRIHAYAVDVVQDAGAYPSMGAGLPNNTRVMLTGCYDIPTAGFAARSVVTNTVPVGSYRGAGRPEAAAAIERAVDRFAAEIGLDPAEVRRRNFLRPEQFPLQTLSGAPYDCGEYEKALDLALAASGYSALRAEQARRRAAGEAKLLGIGLASYVERTAGLMGSEYAGLSLRADGSVLARTGSSPYGQGHHTAWAMLIADRTGIPLDRIEVVHGDTDVVPSGGMTGGSRSVQIAGMAIWEASAQLVELARERAAALLEANPADVALDAERGVFSVAGTPSITVSWPEIAAAAEQEKNPLHAMTDYEAKSATFPFGTHVAVVEVDVETGAVTLERLIAVDDAGIILNPLLADGQVHGGLAQGAAQALLEEFVYDPSGAPLTSTLATYPAISAAELPSFERVMMETPTPVNELGAKGIGESGTVGATPAVQNAVIDALAHLGVRHLDMPATPERVWRAVAAARGPV